MVIANHPAKLPSVRQQIELHEALRMDLAIRAEALRRGLEATQPLSIARLAELCEVGERMQASAARVLRATHELDAVLR
ncbi:hypothetical protein [Caenimonas sp. SL110]|uniref:hypothetical protein n=1 Tax=Caenimonas sp. SL110 TaxID=1450524 RepID=UPI00128C388E|nr:hypothetical protein [Caenimonas sp. SL110]